MTEITPEGRELAAKLTNAEDGVSQGTWFAGDFLTLSPYQPITSALARLATNHLALKAEHEKAVADLREIDRQFEQGGVTWCTQDPLGKAQTIAAKYRETDPLVSELAEALELTHVHFSSEECATALIAELSKRGFELARVKP